MLEILLSGLISGISASISAFLIYKYMKKDVKEEFFSFLESQEGMIYVSSVGKLIGAGFMSVMKIPSGQKNMNIFGFKLPTQVVMAVIERSGFLKGAKDVVGNKLLEGLGVG